MHKVTVHYDKHQKVLLNVGCIPTINPHDIDSTKASFEKYAELTFRTLQGDQCPFLSEKYPGVRSMMVGDIVEWEGLDVLAFCDMTGWAFIEKRELDMFLSLPDDARRLSFSYAKQKIEEN